ncbi:DUF423 domain-containing protein [Zavarzinia sp. CC-PAN008]|uniref:DUF423 domain-containing protein n=1 Tax=Zavarzinia sp. CC-PAN008 TaxID=3243332 RepID=UPI003F7436D8
MAASAWLAIGAVAGGLAVAFGAFGAHGLKGRLTPDDLAIYNTAAQYQLTHALALVGAALLALQRSSHWSTTAAALFLAGMILFCGALYTLSLGGPRFLGAVAPIGGLSLMAGWAALAIAALKP